MIPVVRSFTPDVLVRNGAQWLNDLHRAIEELERLQTDPSATQQDLQRAREKISKTRKRYNHEAIKSALVKMFYGKCAYCESQIRHITYGHIEHFCPKDNAGCIDQTFEWSNLLLACDICNNAGHKGTKYPVDSE